MNYIPTYFDIRELVPEAIYRQRGLAAWELLDFRLLMALDRLRKQYGPMFINTWFSPELIKTYQFRDQSGFRTAAHYKSIAEYEKSLSQHKFGRAGDILFQDFTADQVRSDIIENPDEFGLIAAIELDVPWLHIDVRNCQRILTFKP